MRVGSDLLAAVSASPGRALCSLVFSGWRDWICLGRSSRGESCLCVVDGSRLWRCHALRPPGTVTDRLCLGANGRKLACVLSVRDQTGVARVRLCLVSADVKSRG